MRAALVTGDVVIRRCGRNAVQAALADCAQWADLGRARRAIALLDGRSESPLESVSRAIFVKHSLPAPELQVEFEPTPGTTYRADFYWRGERVIGEADGMGKYDAPGALRAEKIRQELLEDLGLRIVRWTWRDMVADTDRTIARVRGALASGRERSRRLR